MPIKHTITVLVDEDGIRCHNGCPHLKASISRLRRCRLFKWQLSGGYSCARCPDCLKRFSTGKYTYGEDD